MIQQFDFTLMRSGALAQLGAHHTGSVRVTGAIFRKRTNI